MCELAIRAARNRRPRGRSDSRFGFPTGSSKGCHPSSIATRSVHMNDQTAQTVLPAPAQQKVYSPMVGQFLEYLKLERHFSDYTVKSYGADLTQFGQYLSGQIGH